MAEPLVWYVGDRDPSITQQITAGGSPVDLTGATVKFRMRKLGSATLKVDATAAVVAPLTGDVSYTFAAADVDTAGFYQVWWEVTKSGRVQSIIEAMIEIRAHGPQTGHLIEIEELRQAMETRTVDRDLDDQALVMIGAASDLIQDECQRELCPTDAATREFEICNTHTLSLAPYDLRSTPSAVVLDPNGNAVTLVADTDYQLRPIGGDRNGLYRSIKFASTLPILSNVEWQFGTVRLSITADWGPAETPPIAKRACIVTVQSWLRRSVASYGEYSDVGVAPAAPTTYALPMAAKSILNPLRRLTGVA